MRRLPGDDADRGRCLIHQPDATRLVGVDAVGDGRPKALVGSAARPCPELTAQEPFELVLGPEPPSLAWDGLQRWPPAERDEQLMERGQRRELDASLAPHRWPERVRC